MQYASLQRATSGAEFEQYVDWLLAAAAAQEAAGHNQWTRAGIRNQLDHLQARFAAGELFVAAGLGGCLLSARRPLIWQDVNGDALYVDRMVRATHQRGAGRALLDAIETYALAAGFHETRLDCVAHSHFLVRFYSDQGYSAHGEIDRHGTPRLRMAKRLDYANELASRLDDWQPDLVGTLLFVVRERRVLLIRKLRGHGQGKINGPGGKREVGESARACARRETAEETGVLVERPAPRARLRFVATDDDQWLGYVFVAHRFSGLPHPSAEAEPFWCPIDSLPLDQMWEDDRLWLPRVLAGEQLAGDFLFTDGRLVAHRLGPLGKDQLAEFEQPGAA